MKSSIMMEPGLRHGTSAKSNLPFTLLGTEGNSPVLHLFKIPRGRSLFGVDSSEKPKFGVVTMNGCISVYDTMFRRITWKRQTNLGKVSWGALIWGGISSDPSILMQSRQCGFHLVKPIIMQGDCVQPDDRNNVNELLSNETHIGFCKPILCSDQHVVVPLGSDKIGIYMQGDKSITSCFSFQATIMSVKEIAYRGDESSTKYLMCTSEDGYVYLLRVKLEVNSCSKWQVTLVSKLLLPNYEDSGGQQPIGLCVEGCNDLFVVGSNLKFMFLVKWVPEECSGGEGDNAGCLQPFGKKILPTEGVNCMAMREKKGILAAGCFDGTVRIFGFPEMNQISTIQYHKTQINTLLFINEKSGKDGRWYLLCGASDSGLSVWNIPTSRVDCGANPAIQFQQSIFS